MGLNWVRHGYITIRLSQAGLGLGLVGTWLDLTRLEVVGLGLGLGLSWVRLR